MVKPSYFKQLTEEKKNIEFQSSVQMMENLSKVVNHGSFNDDEKLKLLKQIISQQKSHEIALEQKPPETALEKSPLIEHNNNNIKTHVDVPTVYEHEQIKPHDATTQRISLKAKKERNKAKKKYKNASSNTHSLPFNLNERIFENTIQSDDETVEMKNHKRVVEDVSFDSFLLEQVKKKMEQEDGRLIKLRRELPNKIRIYENLVSPFDVITVDLVEARAQYEKENSDLLNTSGDQAMYKKRIFRNKKVKIAPNKYVKNSEKISWEPL